MNVAPMEYVRGVRLHRAQSLLAASDEAIGQIAARCGFEDAAHFSRAFKEYSASSPLEFRRHARAFSAKIPHDNPSD
jgi:transcriptional regulator GlxA family with amidase domain